MIRPVAHLMLHFIVPGVVSRVAYPNRWRYAWLVMVATMVVDLDHLLADPIYDPYRCSIGFHPLHSYAALIVYLVLTGVKKTRIVGIGLVIHMVLDWIDCSMI
jgi:hypothetical protein